MSKQPDALLLADALDVVWDAGVVPEAAAELRRLHALNQELLSALNAMLIEMSMDEDEWNAPAFDQARAAVAKAKEQQ